MSHRVSNRRMTLATAGPKSGGPTSTQAPVSPSSFAVWVLPPSRYVTSALTGPSDMSSNQRSLFT